MYGMIKHYLIKAIVIFKFRKIHFKFEGRNTAYKHITSNYSNADKISIGDNVHIGPGAMLDGAGQIEIQEGCIFAPDVKIYSRTHNFDQQLQALPFDNVMLTAPVTIGRYTWVGTNVIILPGVTIGEGAIIGAGSVVSKNIPAYAVAVGNPARVVRYRDSSRFKALLEEPEPFVYTKLGHAKVFLPKSE